MESLEKVEQLTANSSYDPTKWNDGAPPALNAANLKKIETAIQENRAAGNDIIGEVNKTQKNNEALEKNIKEVNDTVNSLTLVNLNDPKPEDKTIVVLDGGEYK